MKPYLAVGLMSGTSLDGLDGVLIRATPTSSGYDVKTIADHFIPYAERWAETARTIASKNQLLESALFAAAWSEHAALLVGKLCRKAGVRPERVDVIGAHGQTVRHAPKPTPFLGRPLATTIQLADLSRLALRTGIDVIGNFRTADIAAGGHGAPLAPHGHKLLFGQRGKTIAVQNLGGIGNVTLLRGSSVATAFDTGPGNIWIDTTMRWVTKGSRKHDLGGNLAKTGTPDRALVKKICGHPYFRKKPPKSADWADFGPSYLSRFRPALLKLRKEDALATVTSATARATADAYRAFVFPVSKPEEIVISGGGAKNLFLMALLYREFWPIPVRTSEAFGIPVDQVEAICFALLALQTLRRKPNNEPRATGAKRAVVCGQLAPASTRVAS